MMPKRFRSICEEAVRHPQTLRAWGLEDSVQGDVTSLLDARRRENAQTPQINTHLFYLHVAKEQLTNRRGWYEAGKIHQALSGDMLRSKSEVIIANLLFSSRELKNARSWDDGIERTGGRRKEAESREQAESDE